MAALTVIYTTPRNWRTTVAQPQHFTGPYSRPYPSAGICPMTCSCVDDSANSRGEVPGSISNGLQHSLDRLAEGRGHDNRDTRARTRFRVDFVTPTEQPRALAHGEKPETGS